MGKDQKQRVIRTSAILTTLLLTAMLLARGATQIVASKLLPLAPETDKPGALARPRATVAETRETTRQIAEAILTRNMFDSQIGPMEWDVAVAVAPKRDRSRRP
jgi:hypothetical protein